MLSGYFVAFDFWAFDFVAADLPAALFVVGLPVATLPVAELLAADFFPADLLAPVFFADDLLATRPEERFFVSLAVAGREAFVFADFAPPACRIALRAGFNGSALAFRLTGDH